MLSRLRWTPRVVFIRVYDIYIYNSICFRFLDTFGCTDNNWCSPPRGLAVIVGRCVACWALQQHSRHFSTQHHLKLLHVECTGKVRPDGAQEEALVAQRLFHPLPHTGKIRPDGAAEEAFRPSGASTVTISGFLLSTTGRAVVSFSPERCSADAQWFPFLAKKNNEFAWFLVVLVSTKRISMVSLCVCVVSIKNFKCVGGEKSGGHNSCLGGMGPHAPER